MDPVSHRLRRRHVLRGMTALAATPAIAAVLAACGQAPSAAPTSGAASAPTTAPAASTTGGSGGKVTIRFYTDETDPPSIQFYHNAINQYQKDHPNVTISLSPVAGKNMDQKVATAIAAKTAPEVAKQVEAAYMQLAVENFLYPIDKWITEIGHDDFKPNSLYVINGKVYNFPYAGGGYGQTWYRTDLFDAAGLKPPTTWPEWLAAAKTLTKNGVYGFAAPGQKEGALTRLISALIWANGGTYFDSKLNVAIDGASKDAIKGALDFYKEMTAYAPPGWPGMDADGVIDSFLAKRTAMLHYAGRPLERAQQNAPSLVPLMKAFRDPKSPAGHHAHYDHYDSYVLFNKDVGSHDPEASGDFTKYLITGDTSIEFLHTVPGHLSPALYSIEKNPKLWDNELMQSHKDSVELVFRPGGMYYLTEAGAKPNEQGDMRSIGIFNLYGGAAPAVDIPAEMAQRYVIQKQPIDDVIKWCADQFNKYADPLKKQIKPEQFGYKP